MNVIHRPMKASMVGAAPVSLDDSHGVAIGEDEEKVAISCLASGSVGINNNNSNNGSSTSTSIAFGQSTAEMSHSRTAMSSPSSTALYFISSSYEKQEQQQQHQQKQSPKKINKHKSDAAMCNDHHADKATVAQTTVTTTVTTHEEINQRISPMSPSEVSKERSLHNIYNIGNTNTNYDHDHRPPDIAPILSVSSTASNSSNTSSTSYNTTSTAATTNAGTDRDRRTRATTATATSTSTTTTYVSPFVSFDEMLAVQSSSSSNSSHESNPGSRDEEEFLYSDDSDSLSDAYFLPQSRQSRSNRVSSSSRNDVINSNVEPIIGPLSDTNYTQTLQQHQHQRPHSINEHVSLFYTTTDSGSSITQHTSSIGTSCTPSHYGSIDDSLQQQQQQQDHLHQHHNHPQHQQQQQQQQQQHGISVPSNDTIPPLLESMERRRQQYNLNTNDSDDASMDVLFCDEDRQPSRYRRQFSPTTSKGLAQTRKQVRQCRAEQESKCNDAFFAFLFLLQLLVVFSLALQYGWNLTGSPSPVVDLTQPSSFTTADSNNSEPVSPPTAAFSIDCQNVIRIMCSSGLYTTVMSYLTVGFYLIIGPALISVTLVSTITILVAIWGLSILIFDPHTPLDYITWSSFVAFIAVSIYAMHSWYHIPAASVNLSTALFALRYSTDLLLLGIAMIALALLWCLVWAVALVGLINSANLGGSDLRSTQLPTIIFLLISFYWTNMVIKNIVRVTVASTISTWWFHVDDDDDVDDYECDDYDDCNRNDHDDPQGYSYQRQIRTNNNNTLQQQRRKQQHQESCGFCTSGLPLGQSLTRKLGSICLSGLVSPPIEAVVWCVDASAWLIRASCAEIKSDEHQTQRHDQEYHITIDGQGRREEDDGDDAMVSPGCSCFWRISDFFRSFNGWAYCFVGIYGCGFLEGGRRAMQVLYRDKETARAVQDNMIQNVLYITSFIISTTAGLFAILVEEMDGYLFTSLNKPVETAFCIGLLLGIVLSNVIILGVVGSAVNTIYVCYAIEPLGLSENHPSLGREMKEVWTANHDDDDHNKKGSFADAFYGNRS